MYFSCPYQKTKSWSEKKMLHVICGCANQNELLNENVLENSFKKISCQWHLECLSNKTATGLIASFPENS